MIEPQQTIVSVRFAAMNKVSNTFCADSFTRTSIVVLYHRNLSRICSVTRWKNLLFAISLRWSGGKSTTLTHMGNWRDSSGKRHVVAGCGNRPQSALQQLCLVLSGLPLPLDLVYASHLNGEW